MYSLFLLLCGLGTCSWAMTIVHPGPVYPPTKGEVWPKPHYENKEQSFYTFEREKFNITIISLSCSLLTNNVNRYIGILSNLQDSVNSFRGTIPVKEKNGKEVPTGTEHQGVIKELQVDLTAPCEVDPHLEMDEKYYLVVSEVSRLNSSSIWGIIRGLETFSQLFYATDDYTEIRIKSTKITDYPRYRHRGLLLDTSRHYVSVKNILLTLVAMAINKMNVLHWHIVDDHSFPYESEKFPTLSELGAFSRKAVYTKQDIEKIVDYARDRGIRVIPEFDVPGHTSSWGASHPNILTKCYEGGEFIGLGPMNPIENSTYNLLRDLFEEVQDRFPDKYIHVGGDEVDMDCWRSNPEVAQYMRENHISSLSQLHALFMENVIPLLQQRSVPIVWQEVFDNSVPLSNDTIVQVWKSGPEEIHEILDSGHRVLYSTPWYLDHLNKDWQSMYKADPLLYVGSHHNIDNLLGGEACMWGEMVDDRNMVSRVWPRASAVAERLWSAPTLSNPQHYSSYYPSYQRIPDEVYHRIEEHTCRMLARGIPASPPTGPGYCGLV